MSATNSDEEENIYDSRINDPLVINNPYIEFLKKARDFEDKRDHETSYFYDVMNDQILDSVPDEVVMADIVDLSKEQQKLPEVFQTWNNVLNDEIMAKLNAYWKHMEVFDSCAQKMEELSHDLEESVKKSMKRRDATPQYIKIKEYKIAKRKKNTLDRKRLYGQIKDMNEKGFYTTNFKFNGPQ